MRRLVGINPTLERSQLYPARYARRPPMCTLACRTVVHGVRYRRFVGAGVQAGVRTGVYMQGVYTGRVLYGCVHLRPDT